MKRDSEFIAISFHSFYTKNKPIMTILYRKDWIVMYKYEEEALKKKHPYYQGIDITELDNMDMINKNDKRYI